MFYGLVLYSFLTRVGSVGGQLEFFMFNHKNLPRLSSMFFIDIFAKFILLITTCQQASTTGLIISGFGLSAFLFSTISHVFFADSTSQLLLLLSWGSSFTMVLGFFFVCPIPLPEEELNPKGFLETISLVYEQHNSSHTPLLIHDPHINGHANDDAQIGVEPNPSLASQNYGTSRRISDCDTYGALAVR